jgi:transcriptional regulator with XRE-family HTH domain
VNVEAALRRARTRAGLTQAELAEMADTSQAAVSAYESGRKRPSVDTLERLLSAAGARLVVQPDRGRLIVPSGQRHRETGRALVDVLALAELLPTRHSSELAFPRLTARAEPT